MRLDLFLKVSRLVTRRSGAQELCDEGLVSVNGQQAKSSKEVKAGDEIEIKRRNRRTVVRVSAMPASKQVSKADAGSLYETIEDVAIPDTLFNRGSA